MIEAMLGDVGRSVLSFYEAHALILSLAILAYGALMYLSWANLVRIYRYLVVAAARELGEVGPTRKAGPWRNGAGKLPPLPWQAAVDSARFPLVSRRAGLLPMRKSVRAAQAIIDEQELLRHARAVVAGADPRRISPAYRLAAPKKDGTDPGETGRTPKKVEGNGKD